MSLLSISFSSDSTGEGLPFVTRVSSSVLPAGTKVYWNIHGLNVNIKDISGQSQSLEGVASIGVDGSFTLEHIFSKDYTTEGDEIASLSLFLDSSRRELSKRSSFTIKDTTSGNIPVYIVEPSWDVVDEGSSVNLPVKVTAYNVPPKTALFTTYSGDGISGEDFGGLTSTINRSRRELSAAGTFTFYINPYGDKKSEGVEKLRISVYESNESTEELAFAEIRINDTSQDIPIFQVLPSTASVAEGETLVTRIKAPGLVEGTLVDWMLERDPEYFFSKYWSFDSLDLSLTSKDRIEGTGRIDANGEFILEHTFSEDGSLEGVEKFRFVVTKRGRPSSKYESPYISISDSPRVREVRATAERDRLIGTPLKEDIFYFEELDQSTLKMQYNETIRAFNYDTITGYESNDSIVVKDWLAKRILLTESIHLRGKPYEWLTEPDINVAVGRWIGIPEGSARAFTIEDFSGTFVWLGDRHPKFDELNDGLVFLEDFWVSDSSPIAIGIAPSVNNGQATFSITGTNAVGETLFASESSADPDGNGNFSHTWEASANSTSWSSVGTGPSLTITNAHEGQKIRLQTSYTDGQGFEELVTSEEVLIPDLPPAPPSAPDLLESSDTGISDADDITNDTTPTFTGTAEADSTIELFADASSLGSTSSNRNGNWSFTVAASEAFADGSYAITAIASTGSKGNSLTLQRTPIPVASPGRSYHEHRSESAFAVLKDDGSVITWGDSRLGGDSSSVRTQIQADVSQIFSNRRAFAALKNNGSVVTWGESGGDSTSVEDKLQGGVTQIFSTWSAFAALKDDGSVISWGSYPGSNWRYTTPQTGVTRIFSTRGAFAALKDDGSVDTWGGYDYGVNTSSIIDDQLRSDVTNIFATERAFAALKNDGSVITWGDSGYGGNSSSVSAHLGSGVSQIFSNDRAFAALKNDGSVITWGDSGYGGNSSSVRAHLGSGVSQIFSNDGAFAALKNDGSVITWGVGYYGGDSSTVADQLNSSVSQIFSTRGAFAALKDDRSVVAWGFLGSGGDTTIVNDQLQSGVTKIFSTENAFAALKDDGSVVTWGGSGGDSSSVADQLQSGVASFADPFHDDRLVENTLATSDLSPALSLTIDTTAPAFASPGPAEAIDENSGAGQLIYTAAATDDSFVSYSLKAANNDDAAAFSIDSLTGEVTLTANPDYETQPSYAFTVVATDAAGNSSEQPVALAINDLDDTPPMDLTGDGEVDETDGLLMMRHMVGTFPGDAITQGIAGIADVNGLRNRISRIMEQSSSLGTGSLLDIDGDGVINPFSDGMMILKHIHGKGREAPGGLPEMPEFIKNPMRDMSQMQNHLKDLIGF
jgi:hypothetical protein